MLCVRKYLNEGRIHFFTLLSNRSSKETTVVTCFEPRGRVGMSHHRVCSRHFPGGDKSHHPSLCLGKRFASPKKAWTPRAKRAQCRDLTRRQLSYSTSQPTRPQVPTGTTTMDTTEAGVSPLVVTVGEPLSSDHQVHELYSDTDSEASYTITTIFVSNCYS